jgi:hypothetical protein
VLLRLAYLALCRSIRLLVLFARGDAAKELEILVLRHQLAVLRRQTPRPNLEPADRALLAATSRVLPRARWSCFFPTPETLLRWHRRLVAGAWTHPHRQTVRPSLDQQLQQLIVRLAKENPRWLPAHQRRTPAPWHPGLRHHHPHHPASSPAGSRAPADDDDVAGVPAPAGHRDHGVRPLYRRHHLTATVVRAVLHRTGHPSGSPGRGDRQPQRRLGHPAGPQPARGAQGAGPAGALSHP